MYNINIIKLSLNELKLIARDRNIQDYKNKSEDDLIKILTEPKPKISITKKKLKEIENDFRELRHKFSKEEIDKFRKSLYNIKNYRNLYESEIRKAGKNLAELEENLQSIKLFVDDENKNIDDIRRLFYVLKPKKTDNGFVDKTSGEWKIQLVIQNKCISSKNFEETRSVYSASNNIEIFIGSVTDEVIDRHFDTMLERFQEAKET